MNCVQQLYGWVETVQETMGGASLSGAESKDSLCEEVSKVRCDPGGSCGTAVVERQEEPEGKAARTQREGPGQQKKQKINNTRAAPAPHPQSSKCSRQDQV